MTQFGDGRETSRRTGRADDVQGSSTSTDADMSARMAGTHQNAGASQTIRPTEQQHVVRTGGQDVHGAKTSAAAVFALVFGLAALFCALTAILSPVAVVFGLLGIVLGIAGLAMSKRPGVTGRGVAIGGLVTAVLGLLLGGAVIAGLSALVNDDRRLDQLQTRIDDLRDELPTTGEVREQVS